jgi:4'-phosphopantetheinyl transferase
LSGSGRKAVPELPGDECHVWWAALTNCASWHTRLLDATESGRYRSYRRAADRDRFTVGVTLTRLVLGAHLGIPPDSVPLDRTCASCGGQHGRPRLATGAPVDFSVSHSADMIGLAIARSLDGAGATRQVGLDVELIDSATADEAPLDLVLSPAERRSYHQLDPTARARAFFRYWVRKEALLKATGDGLRVPMTQLTMSAPDQPPRLADWEGRPGYPALVSMRDLIARPSYMAALAIVGRDAAVICHDAADLMSSDDFLRLRPSE